MNPHVVQSATTNALKDQKAKLETVEYHLIELMDKMKRLELRNADSEAVQRDSSVILRDAMPRFKCDMILCKSLPNFTITTLKT
jgi:hypothetical protein